MASVFQTVMNLRYATLAMLGRSLMTLSVCTALAGLAACGDTKGVSSAFKMKATTNSDFTSNLFPTGNYPIGLAAGTFLTATDSDGFVVSNYLSGTVSVFLKTGVAPPTFSKTDYPVGDFPTQIFLTDLDGDGFLDIGVVTETTNHLNNLVFLFNDSSDNFSNVPSTLYASGAVIQQVAHACMRAGCSAGVAEDLVLSLPDQKQMRILINDGTGAFPTVHSNDAGDGTGFFALGDFDGINGTDIVVTVPSDNRVRTLLNDGSGGIASAANWATDTRPTDVAVADFDNDGSEDLVIAALDEDRVNFRFGNGNGTFAASINSNVRDKPERIFLDNFQGGPQPDIIVIHSGKDYFSIFDNNEDGSFALHVEDSSQTIAGFASGLFTTTGFKDLVAAETHDRVLGVYKGNGAGGFSRTQVAFDSQVTQPTAVKFCNGGAATHDDVLLVQTFSDQVVLLCNVNP